ncbi:hypothetical protein [Methylobacterium currus]|nr:hypothetical protein [Methylobacterium currus]
MSLASKNPMSRVGEADEIARAVLVPASGDASLVNGIEPLVAGGQARV